MKTVARKWGDAIGIRIPSAYAEKFGLENGISVGNEEWSDQRLTYLVAETWCGWPSTLKQDMSNEDEDRL